MALGYLLLPGHFYECIICTQESTVFPRCPVYAGHPVGGLLNIIHEGWLDLPLELPEHPVKTDAVEGVAALHLLPRLGA